jgi:GntR family transcriptional regulator
MNFSLDFQGKEPIYLQLIGQVKAQIKSGALKPGDQLPTVREVAATLRINFNTAARAYRMLHEEGVISTQQGRGTFVPDRPAASKNDRPRDQQLRALLAGWQKEAARQGFTEAEVNALWTELTAQSQN